MPALTPEALRKQIAKRSLAPVYLIAGDDEAGKASLAAAFADAVDPELRAFNLERVYGGEPGARFTAILDIVRTLPWMAPRRVVIVMHADKLLVSRREEAGSADLEELERYLGDPVPTTVLVLVAGDLDKRLGVTKALYRAATVVECGGVAGARDVETWVKARAAEAGIVFEPAALRAMVERTGGEVARLRADLARLLLFAAESRRVSAADVRELVGPVGSRDPWAMNRALERGATGEALRELALLLDEGAVPYMVLGQIRAYVERSVPPHHVNAATEALLRTDLALKTSGGDPRVLLERLVVELCERTTAAGRRQS